ncbi:hypothetical protein [Nitrospira sp. Ecomares 2.1]
MFILGQAGSILYLIAGRTASTTDPITGHKQVSHGAHEYSDYGQIQAPSN